ncbi:PIN/TRAM domain-containing protein [Paenibacillus xylanexedens]|uniref:PIN/TRAM domain-containing protein n=1 Tax=Paenibacillus xylanexedens TaxID=528191 RepID=UPI001F251535|nr:PIN/TRAM domain-containing protein [Paenibacillus xylanexedens]MCF7758759.1 PIN/TRAM domain-containing protein [Paenibacillus xylanexedens]
MWKKGILTFTGLCGAWFGYTAYHLAGKSVPWMAEWIQSAGLLGAGISTLLGAVMFMAVCNIGGTLMADRLHSGIDSLAKVPMNELAAGAAGAVAGLLVALLLYPVVGWMGTAGEVLQVALTVISAYSGYTLAMAKKDDLGAFWMSGRWGHPEVDEDRRMEEHKILDTSVIIDGRIADICKTGFIEGTIVIPEFVLEELQHIADSSDLLKRNRGRRGLDILNKIQKELDVKVLIYEGDFEEISEVDSKLVKLAKVLQGKVVTNDFNLNKVCELQGVSVLNINDLANAVKPVVLPGEEIMVQIIKDGKEHGQGVAYLDDGTMIVVEGGREYIGMMMEVLVTSVLQTSAGRMIFAKPKLLEKAQ